jgi:hypothetical protein
MADVEDVRFLDHGGQQRVVLVVRGKDEERLRG